MAGVQRTIEPSVVPLVRTRACMTGWSKCERQAFHPIATALSGDDNETPALPDISAYWTVQGDCVREDFWLIVTARSGDETEIRERERSCRTGQTELTGRSGKTGVFDHLHESTHSIRPVHFDPNCFHAGNSYELWRNCFRLVLAPYPDHARVGKATALAKGTNMKIRRAADRGHADLGWLNSWHSFSFGEYYDPAHMGLGPLRVINDDRFAPGAGFPTHPHADMEIVSYVLEGALEHKDSTGGGSVIRPGEVQRMSAGTGIRHSEFNASSDEPVHFLQIWIVPSKKGLAPGYEQKQFPEAEKRGRLRLVASPDGQENSVIVHQDAKLYASVLGSGDAVTHDLGNERLAWLQVARGSAKINGQILDTGDGAAIDKAGLIEISGTSKEAELLLFDMAA